MKNLIVSLGLLTLFNTLHTMEPNQRDARLQLVNAIKAQNKLGTEIALVHVVNLNAPGLNAGEDDPPLCVAAGIENKRILQLLLDNNAEPGVIDGMGDTPFHHAVQRGRLNNLMILYAHAAKQDPETIILESRNVSGQTVLLKALDIEPPNYDIIKWLLEHRANTNAQDDDGNSAAHYCYTHQREDIKTLLDTVDDIDWQLPNNAGVLPENMQIRSCYDTPSPEPESASSSLCASPKPEDTIAYVNHDELFGIFYTEEEREAFYAQNALRDINDPFLEEDAAPLLKEDSPLLGEEEDMTPLLLIRETVFINQSNATQEESDAHPESGTSCESGESQESTEDQKSSADETVVFEDAPIVAAPPAQPAEANAFFVNLFKEAASQDDDTDWDSD